MLEFNDIIYGQEMVVAIKSFGHSHSLECIENIDQYGVDERNCIREAILCREYECRNLFIKDIKDISLEDIRGLNAS